MLKVSVIMPAYNASRFISEAIDSVIAQTFTGWELIIVDDGSVDVTSEIVKEYLSRDSRISYYYQENGKQGKARNLGISKSKGFYIAFLDADDLWLPGKLEIQLQEIKEKNVDLVFSNSFIFNDNNVLDRSRNMSVLNQVLKGEEALKLFLIGNRIPTLTVLVKKESINLVDGFTEKNEIPLAEDYHLWLKMLISGLVFYGSDKILASYRVHIGSSTSQDKLASKQLPEVFLDLLQNNPAEKSILINAIKKVFRKNYNERNFTKSDLYLEISENCRYLNKQFYSPFYKIINYFFGVKVAKKLLCHLLNG